MSEKITILMREKRQVNKELTMIISSPDISALLLKKNI